MRIVDPSSTNLDDSVAWLARSVPPGGTLNVAGPRASEADPAPARVWLAAFLGRIVAG